MKTIADINNIPPKRDIPRENLQEFFEIMCLSQFDIYKIRSACEGSNFDITLKYNNKFYTVQIYVTPATEPLSYIYEGFVDEEISEALSEKLKEEHG